ncbi:MAG: PAS domain S-box protein [Acidobacteriia bacterium]|nr:PAS domain S-box protein [Terriglobia bacterium]
MSPMSSVNITARVWLSIGIFVLGFGFLMVLEDAQGKRSERRMQYTSAVLFPAAQESQRAMVSFQLMARNFSDAVVMQDAMALRRAQENGGNLVILLRHLAALSSLSPERAGEASRLASSVEQLLRDAGAIYPAAIADDLRPKDQERIRDLAARMEASRTALSAFRDSAAASLHDELAELQRRSRNMRSLVRAVSVLTFLLSAVLVSRTIRRNITKPLEAAQHELAHERDLLRVLLDNIPDFIAFKDASLRFIRINRANSELLGISDPQKACGRTLLDFWDCEAAREMVREEQEAMLSGRPTAGRIEQVTIGDSTRWLMTTNVPVKRADGTVDQMVSVARDVTELQRAIKALETSENSFRLLFDAIPHAVWLVDAKTLKFLVVNNAAVRHYGYSQREFLATDLYTIHVPEESSRLRYSLALMGPLTPLATNWRHRTRDGLILEVEVTAHALEFQGKKAILAVSQDNTSRKKLEAELRQAQKLESVGQLAAGIAHELNTPIQYIGDNIRFLQDAFDTRQRALDQYQHLLEAAESSAVTTSLISLVRQTVDEADLHYLSEEIPKAMSQSLDGVDRVATIVRAMKEFAHPGFKEKTAADLNKALSNALVVSRNELKYVADVETDFGKLPPVMCHIADVNQVFLNLLINAADAIREVVKESKGRGLIRVETRRVGNQVTVTISDTGCGIPPAIRHRVFDPFFTTKPVGQGSGQGLAIARTTIIDKHGGSLRFEPNGSQGTKFIISLPVEPVQAGIAEESAQSIAPADPDLLSRHHPQPA